MVSAAHSAVVTGAARGIGRAVASRLAREGFSVTLVDADPQVSATAAELEGARSEILDVTDRAAVEALFADADPPYRTVVINAGIGMSPAPLVDVDDQVWDQVLAVNLTAVFLAMRAAAGRLARESLQGRIIVTASVAGLVPEPAATPYTAAKFGVVGLVRAAAAELAPAGIRVNAVCPGDVDTNLLRQFSGGDPDALSAIPLGQPARPEQIAGLYAFLASPEADYMTGSTVVIDGGLLSTTLM